MKHARMSGRIVASDLPLNSENSADATIFNAFATKSEPFRRNFKAYATWPNAASVPPISYLQSQNKLKTIMKKVTMFSYSVISYAIAFASLMLWILSVSHLIPAISIDRPQQLPTVWALLKNFGLVSLFGLHHSITARKP